MVQDLKLFFADYPRQVLDMQGVRPSELPAGLMRMIDERFLGGRSSLSARRPGTCAMTRNFANEKRIDRLMGLMPIYQKPNTSRPAKGRKTYPYTYGEVCLWSARAGS